MEKEDKVIFAIMSCASLAIGLFFTFYFALPIYESKVAHDNFKKTLEAEGYTVLDAQFNSPKITIKCHSQTEFLQKAHELNTTTVYDVGLTFYVVDADVTFAYSYTA